MHNKHSALLKSFPDQELLIRRLLLHDREFCAVCEDYEDCVAAFRHWTQNGDQSRAEEYRQLQVEIEAEVTNFLAARNNRQVWPAPKQGAG